MGQMTGVESTLNCLFDIDVLESAVAAGWVHRKAHPSLPLDILTYARQCQYEQRWDDVTTQCRGLVVEHGTGRIVARPLRKFFNFAEHGLGRSYAPPLPAEPFDVFAKVDGSLAIVFHYDGRWHAASKGAFTSEQALWSQRWLDVHDLSALTPGVTYLAEAVYPQNRIVVGYPGVEDLVFLAAVGPDGVELEFDAAAAVWLTLGGTAAWRFPLPPSVDEVAQLAAENRDLDGDTVGGQDAEGYVIRFASGARVKVKFADYLRLHRLVTGITAREVWRYGGVDRFASTLTDKELGRTLGCATDEVAKLRAAGGMASLMEGVPDEFDEWVLATIAGLDGAFDALVDASREAFAEHMPLWDDRAAFARATQGLPSSVRSALFLMLDGRPWEPSLWRAVKPGPSSPFREDDDG